MHGVVTSAQFDKKQAGKKFIPYVSEIDPEAVGRLEQCMDPHTEIVVISSWRKALSLDEIKRILPTLPVTALAEPYLPKELAMLDYLKKNKTDHFVVIDDEFILNVKSPLQNHFVKTAYQTGLVDGDVLQVKEKMMISWRQR